MTSRKKGWALKIWGHDWPKVDFLKIVMFNVSLQIMEVKRSSLKP